MVGTIREYKPKERQTKEIATETVEETSKEIPQVRKAYNTASATAGALSLILANITSLFVFTFIFDNFFLAIASIGVLSFFDTLALADYVSIEPSLSTGEMRSAMTAAIVVIYVAIIGLGAAGKIPDNVGASGVLDNLWMVVATVVGFYFGTKGAIQVAKVLKSK